MPQLVDTATDPLSEKSPSNMGFSLVGRPGFEPGTSCLSSMRSNQLS